MENQVHQDQKGHPERLEILVLQENKDLLVNQENEDQGVQLGNLEVQDLKVYLEWKEDLVLLVHLAPLALPVTPYLLLLQQCQEERLFLEYLDLLDPWDHLGHQGEEELLEVEDQREEGEGLEFQGVLVVQEDKVFQEEQEIQDSQANLVALEEHILKMISGRFVHLY